MKIPRVMICAPKSGGGKTTAVCAILKGLEKKKIKTAACKVGPDYIDPMFHEKILGVKSVNIDGFFCDEEKVKYLFARHVKNAEITVIEGVMGYYDGMSMSDTKGSSYDTARMLKIPVIAVIDARGMAMTAAAVVKGLKEFRSDSRIKAVILNNISEKIYYPMKECIERETGTEVIGYIPKNDDYAIKSRHLGLMTPDDEEEIKRKLDILGEYAVKCIDMDRLIEIAKAADDIEYKKKAAERRFENIRIGVSYDNAFCFLYRDNIRLLEDMGAEIVYFSPVRDKKIPENINGMILCGGYPELYAQQTEDNESMRESIKNAAENGMPILAECGGFMYLQEKIEGSDGKKYRAAGVFKGESVKKERLVRFGYALLSAREDNYLLKKGEIIKAHEFHYWDSTDNGDLFYAEKPDGKMKWECMVGYKNVIGGYPHIYYHSNIKFAENFLKKC
ncbi:MAG: cobyrinate a,c-diamide synthase, partial [Firmicutes bacterium]|nr:cobyrinate a,c-diamide synthase [Bacillota bacterium]